MATPSPAATATDPLIARIVGQAGVIRRKFPAARAIGITIGSASATAADVVARDGRYLVRPCPTPLAARLALRDDTPSDATLVLVTPLADDAVGSDIVGRLADQKLFPLDSWGVVRERFQTPRIDHRIHRHACLADWLAELSAGVDVPKPAGGFLDADTAWSFILAAALGLTDRIYDPVELLVWTLDAAAVRRWHDLTGERRTATVDWFGMRAGAAARAILESLDRRAAGGPLALGLALDVVQRAAGDERPHATLVTRSQVRIDERHFGGRPPAASALAGWGEAAVRAVELHLGAGRDRERRDAIRQADDIIRDIDAVVLARVSRVSLIGFEGRLAEFAAALEAAADRTDTPARRRLLAAFHGLEDHHEAVHASESFSRAEMAVRLARWLADRDAGAGAAPGSLALAATDHLRDGGYVVWARDTLRAGEPLPDFERAIARLVARVDAALDADAARFATQLAGWLGDGGRDGGVVPVEKILERVVAPIAAHAPVLVVVIDGLSAAVYHELAAQMLRSWTAIAPAGADAPPPAIAAVPSETRYSRTSLLAGRLGVGGQAEELAGFERHPALLAAARTSPPPRLFHEADLTATGATGLAAEVRQEIGETTRRVVGVVLNSIDDSLAKGKQTQMRWRLDMLRHLPSLLKAAHDAGRVVVVTGDHGHVLEQATVFHVGGEAARWRPDATRIDDGEVRLTGDRVLAADGRLVAAWRERIRYTTGTSRGYHGGASPQEMVVPIGVFSPWTDPDSLPAGWDLARADVPAWWDEPRRHDVEEPTRIEVTAPPLKGLLFDPETGEVPRPVPQPAAAATPEWIPRLLTGELYRAQKKLLGRGAPDDGQIETALQALAGRGGVMTSAALGRAVRLAPYRLTGFVAALGRLLNIDGFRVVARDMEADDVTLDIPMLRQQFDLLDAEAGP
jgi:hypothetical protein